MKALDAASDHLSTTAGSPLYSHSLLHRIHASSVSKTGDDLVALSSLSSSEKLAFGDGIPTKRSPLPPPVENDRMATGRRGRPASYYEIPNEQDTPINAIIRVNDMLGFVDKAIISGKKENKGSVETYYIKDGVMKWLRRAQASLVRDGDIIQEIRRQYAIKILDTRLAPWQMTRAREKYDEWTRYASVSVSKREN